MKNHLKYLKQKYLKQDNVLPGVVPGHALAPGPQPEDVQHADVLSAVLRQVLWSVWWVEMLKIFTLQSKYLIWNTHKWLHLDSLVLNLIYRMHQKILVSDFDWFLKSKVNKNNLASQLSSYSLIKINNLVLKLVWWMCVRHVEYILFLTMKSKTMMFILCGSLMLQYFMYIELVSTGCWGVMTYACWDGWVASYWTILG